MQSKTYPLPEIEDFFAKEGLYRRFAITDEDIPRAVRIFYFSGTIRMYCYDCREIGIFRGQPNEHLRIRLGSQAVEFNDQQHTLNHDTTLILAGSHMSLIEFIDHPYHKHRYSNVTLTCVRNPKHKYMQYFLLLNRVLIKIGQYPDVADLYKPEMEKYEGVLDKKLTTDLARGVGLYAHGVGAGALVYLRRVFESIIEDEHKKAQTRDGWNEDQYTKSRMAEKIELLRDYLPPFLVQNKTMYGIISSGIHTKSEDECREYFPAIRMGIELILDQRVELKNRQEKEAAASAAIAHYSGRKSGSSS